MRKIILPIIILLLLLGVMSFAQEAELSSPGLTPDSPFYFLETIAEGIGTFFTFGDLKKAERYATLAAERLAEVKAVVEKGKPELAEKTLERYEMQLEKSIARAEKAQAEGQNTEKVMEVVARVGKATSVHLEVLAEVYEKVPEQAKPAIENAMMVSVKGHEKAVEVLKAKNALGEVPEEAPLPVRVPEEVRERIQTKARQELEIEKALQGSESSRDLCIKAGGPSEMCEKIPLQGFESFEALKAFCIEAGGPPEICASLEAKCREVGATTPDECFRVLMTATITTSPAPSLSEEEIEERRRVEEESTRTGYAFLGVQYQIIGKEVQEARNLPVDYGVLLIGAEGEPAVIPGSPAALAGLKEGDVILEFNGERITKDNGLAEMVSRSKVGEVVSLKVLRGEEVIVINVELTEKPAN